MVERGLTQSAVARRLGTSQSSICKILSGRHNPRPALRAAIERLVGPIQGEVMRELIDEVASVAARSEAFRAMLKAAVKFANTNE